MLSNASCFKDDGRGGTASGKEISTQGFPKTLFPANSVCKLDNFETGESVGSLFSLQFKDFRFGSLSICPSDLRLFFETSNVLRVVILCNGEIFRRGGGHD